MDKDSSEHFGKLGWIIGATTCLDLIYRRVLGVAIWFH